MLKIFAVRDTTGQTYLPLFESPNVETAKRDFNITAANPDSGSMYFYPKQFELHELGENDRVTGKRSWLDNHINHGTPTQLPGRIFGKAEEKTEETSDES